MYIAMMLAMAIVLLLETRTSAVTDPKLALVNGWVSITIRMTARLHRISPMFATRSHVR